MSENKNVKINHYWLYKYRKIYLLIIKKKQPAGVAPCLEQNAQDRGLAGLPTQFILNWKWISIFLLK